MSIAVRVTEQPESELPSSQRGSSLTVAQLILTSGSHAGVTAPLMIGYYMIGRDAECQLRPKSRSVSRRHCLLHHTGQQLRVLDLRSTAGTFVNEEQLAPLAWRGLNDGDMLHCGKSHFRIHLTYSALQKNANRKAAAEPEVANPSSENTNGSMIQAAAWESFDVADFLDSEDETERENRYSKIREDAGRNFAGEFDLNAESDDDPPEFDTIVADEVAPEPTIGKAKGKPKRAKTPCPPKQSKTAKARTDIRHRLPALDSPDQLKLAAALLVASTVLGFVGWKVYDFSTGPDARVIEQID